MFRSRAFWRGGLALALVMAFGATSASADSETLTLSTPNSALSGFPGPYGTVKVTLVSSTEASFTFTAASGYGFVDGGSAAVNIDCPLGDISVTNVSTGTAVVSDKGKNQLDGFGIYNVNINQANASTLYSTITFDVTCASATWSSVTQVLAPNSNGELVGAHVSTGGTNAVTGFVADGPPPAVPEPSSMAIAGLGVLGFVGYGLRRRVKK